MTFVVRLVINSIALWLTTLLVPGVAVVAFRPKDTGAEILTYLVVALFFGVINATIGRFIRIVAFPLYIIALGLFSLLVNALLLLVISNLSHQIGFGLELDNLGVGVAAAAVLAAFSWVIGSLAGTIGRGSRH